MLCYHCIYVHIYIYKVFKELEIDGEMLWLANDQALKDLGITGLKRNSLTTNFQKEVNKTFNIE